MLEMKKSSSIANHDEELSEEPKEMKHKRRGSSMDKAEATSSRKRLDSDTSSIWSENIPVIKISKTDSTDNILSEENNKEEADKFKPVVKCALKKQHAEVDEDTICFFGIDLERKLSKKKQLGILSMRVSKKVEMMTIRRKLGKRLLTNPRQKGIAAVILYSAYLIV
nr:unnamed protein product [Callosobruchus chinensis]